jgi:hypothetical protein
MSERGRQGRFDESSGGFCVSGPVYINASGGGAGHCGEGGLRRSAGALRGRPAPAEGVACTPKGCRRGGGFPPLKLKTDFE